MRGERSRWWSERTWGPHPPHTNIKNVSMCGTSLTESLLETGRRTPAQASLYERYICNLIGRKKRRLIGKGTMQGWRQWVPSPGVLCIGDKPFWLVGKPQGLSGGGEVGLWEAWTLLMCLCTHACLTPRQGIESSFLVTAQFPMTALLCPSPNQANAPALLTPYNNAALNLGQPQPRRRLNHGIQR